MIKPDVETVDEAPVCLSQTSTEKHVVRRAIFQPRADHAEGVVCFVVTSPTPVEHTIHGTLVLEEDIYDATIQKEVNPLTGILENNND